MSNTFIAPKKLGKYSNRWMLKDETGGLVTRYFSLVIYVCENKLLAVNPEKKYILTKSTTNQCSAKKASPSKASVAARGIASKPLNSQ